MDIDFSSTSVIQLSTSRNICKKLTYTKLQTILRDRRSVNENDVVMECYQIIVTHNERRCVSDQWSDSVQISFCCNISTKATFCLSFKDLEDIFAGPYMGDLLFKKSVSMNYFKNARCGAVS
jgi:hypothetical protein